jgi:hypothetical protein
LSSDFPDEFNDIQEFLLGFQLCQSHILEPGGRKSKVAEAMDGFLLNRGWLETQFDIRIESSHLAKVPGDKKISEVYRTITGNPTHKVDCFKNSIALEVEWNNKDPFYDRDLNNFRLLFELRVINIGVIITRDDELQDIFDELSRGESYGSSTTHMSKLLPRIQGGGGGGCPILVIGITKKRFNKNC